MEMHRVKFHLLNPPKQWPSVKRKESEFEQLIKLVQESGIQETAFAYSLEEQEVKYAVFEYIKNMESRLQILEVSLVSFHEYQQGKWTNIDQESTSKEDKEKGGECESADVQELSDSMTVEKESVNIHVQQVKNIDQESTLKKDKEKGGESSVNVLESSASMTVKKESVIVLLRQINETGTSSAAANPKKKMLTRTKTLGDVTGKEECDLEEIIKQVQLWGIADSCPFVNLGIEDVIDKVREYLKLKKSIVEALKKKVSNVKENAVTRQAVIGTVTGSGPVDTKPEIEGTAGVHVVQSEEVVIGTVTGSGPGDAKPEIVGTAGAGVDVVQDEKVVPGTVIGSGSGDTKSEIEGTAGVDVVERNQSKEALVTNSVGQMDTKPEIACVDVVKEKNQSEEALVTDSVGQMDTRLEVAGVDVVKERTDEAAVSTTAKKEECGFGRGPGMHQQILRQQQQQSIGGVKHEEDSSTIDDMPADPVQPVAQPVQPQQSPLYGLLGWFINNAKRV